jgi:hypothetical protein
MQIVAVKDAQLKVAVAAIHQDFHPVRLHIVLFEARSAFTRVRPRTLAVSPIRDTLIEGLPPRCSDAEQHGLAIDHEGRIAVTQRGLDDQRIAVGPFVSVADE